VVQIDPKNADGWFHLGVSYLEQVESDARSLSAKYKNSGYLRALTAESLVEQRELAQAAEEYKAAVSSRTFPQDAHAEYGFVLLDQHRFPDAEREFKAELAISPGSLMAKLGMARLLIEQGQTIDALKQIEGIWKKQPAFLKCHIALLNTGAQNERAADLRRVLDEQVDAGNISAEFASIMRGASDERGTSDNASRLSTLPTNPPASTTQLFQLAEERYAAGSYDECMENLAPRLQLLQTRQLETLVSCAFLVGDYEVAFRAAQTLSLDIETQASGLYWETKSAQKLAIAALVRASELDSASPRMHVLLGDVYREKNYFPQAEKEYRKALELRPDDNAAMFGLCLVLLADSQTDEALQLAQGNLKQRPEDPEFNAVMGEILCTRQDFSAAEPYLKRGLTGSPELAAHVHALLGKVYAETNRTDQAIAELKLALDHDRDGHIHYQIGRLYLKIGDRQSAQKAFDTSAQLRSAQAKRAALSFENGAEESETQQ
jgi:predicted Zn-dependent protease